MSSRTAIAEEFTLEKFDILIKTKFFCLNSNKEYLPVDVYFDFNLEKSKISTSLADNLSLDIDGESRWLNFKFDINQPAPNGIYLQTSIENEEAVWIGKDFCEHSYIKSISVSLDRDEEKIMEKSQAAKPILKLKVSFDT